MAGWVRRALVGAGLVLAGWAAWPTWQVVSCLLDDQALDDVVVAVALDWRDFGEEKARARLDLEIDRLGLRSRLPAQACGLRVGAQERHTVACAWEVGVAVPGLGRLPLSLASEATIEPDGALLR